jgi:hypothetical protein
MIGYLPGFSQKLDSKGFTQDLATRDWAAQDWAVQDWAVHIA